jgi:flagellar hook-basal body complex protein FliE
MTIEPISMQLVSEIVPERLNLQGPQQGPDFAHTIGDGLRNINADLNAADQATAALAAGRETSTHDVMIALSKARLDMQLVVQVRNRLMSAYQEIARMQV